VNVSLNLKEMWRPFNVSARHSSRGRFVQKMVDLFNVSIHGQFKKIVWIFSFNPCSGNEGLAEKSLV